MAITAKPKRKVDLSTIDDIQDEIFGETGREVRNPADTTVRQKRKPKTPNAVKRTDSIAAKSEALSKKTRESAASTNTEPQLTEESSIAELLSAKKYTGIRYKSRPYTIPRSLIVDLDRLKMELRSRDIHLTQNELIDKMVQESLETVGTDTYFALADKALGYIKSPNLSSRRSVTLTENTVMRINTLKADLSLKAIRKISSEELFISLFAIAFLPHYESGIF